MEKSTNATKQGLAQMFKGGVIMDVVSPEQARIAEQAGAVAVMALERVPADIRTEGGVARMSDPLLIEEIMEVVTIPVMAKVRIGHFVEAQILQSLGVHFIDESEVLTPADEMHHIDKHPFKVPFVCGARDLGEALRRIGEGAAMIRTKGEAGTGNIVEAVRHMRAVMDEIRKLSSMDHSELMNEVRVADRRERQTACREFRRRGSRHTGGCGTHDAARRRRCVCRLRYLQIRGSRYPGAGYRRRGSPLPGFWDSGQGIQGTWQGDAGNRAEHPGRGRAHGRAWLVIRFAQRLERNVLVTGAP